MDKCVHNAIILYKEIFYETKKIDESIYRDLKQQAGTIRRLLISSCRTVKEN